MARQHTPPPSLDPFSGDFSQARAEPVAASWPVLQWHGGLADLAELNKAASVLAEGGFFIEDERIADLGLVPADPLPGFEPLTLRLGGRPIAGWGAARLHLAFLFSDFTWEDRESGRLRFAPTEYERRKRIAPGTERELRGRTRCLVGVREMLDNGVTEPVLLSVRGMYSAALNSILRDARRMADEATRLRRRAGHEGNIPREAFWLPVYRGAMEAVGEGMNTSRVALPKADIPLDLSRDFLISHLVEEPHRRGGGTFDQWAELYSQAWEERIVQGLIGPDDTPPTVAEDGYA